MKGIDNVRFLHFLPHLQLFTTLLRWLPNRWCRTVLSFCLTIYLSFLDFTECPRNKLLKIVNNNKSIPTANFFGPQDQMSLNPVFRLNLNNIIIGTRHYYTSMCEKRAP